MQCLKFCNIEVFAKKLNFLWCCGQLHSRQELKLFMTMSQWFLILFQFKQAFKSEGD